LEIVLSYILGAYDAWAQAGDEKSRRRSHYDYYILGDSSRHHSRNNDDRRGGVRRYADDFVIEKHWPSVFKFHTGADQIAAGIMDLETLLVQKSEEVEVVAKVEVEVKKGARKLQPANLHESQMRNLATDQ